MNNSISMYYTYNIDQLDTDTLNNILCKILLISII